MFKPRFQKPHSQGLVERGSTRGMTPTNTLGCFYTVTREEERKFLFLIFEHYVEAQDEELVKCPIRSKMEAHVKVSVKVQLKVQSRWFRSLIQSPIQCLTREERE